EQDPKGAVFRARRGGGTWQEGERIRVCPGGRPEGKRLSCLPATYWTQFTPLGELRRGVGEVRALGSIAYELASVARGAVQFTLLGGPSIWDVAAGVLLVREAGGEVLARRPRTNEWHPLLRFGPGFNRPPGSLKELRRWRQSLLAANPELARFAAARLRARGRRLSWRAVRRALWRRRRFPSRG
ncbi:MAG: inositol monophosphatase family protein, partial [Nitrospinota bacterium]